MVGIIHHRESRHPAQVLSYVQMYATLPGPDPQPVCFLQMQKPRLSVHSSATLTSLPSTDTNRRRVSPLDCTVTSLMGGYPPVSGLQGEMRREAHQPSQMVLFCYSRLSKIARGLLTVLQDRGYPSSHQPLATSHSLDARKATLHMYPASRGVAQ